MSTDTVRPLRRRMTEDMNARRLCADTQERPHPRCKRFAAFSTASRSGELRNLHAGVTGLEPPFLLTPVATHQG